MLINMDFNLGIENRNPYEIFLKFHKVFVRFYQNTGATISTPAGKVVAYILLSTTGGYTNIDLLTGEIGDPLTTSWYFSDTTFSQGSFLPTSITDSSITFPAATSHSVAEYGLWYLTADEI